MSYSSTADLILAFSESEIIQLTDRDRSGVVDTAIANAKIAEATALIDTYLSEAGYTVPLTTAPAWIQKIAGDLARYFLYDDGRPEAVQDGYDQALKYLQRIATGKESLAGIEKTATGGGATAVLARTQVYGSDFESQY